MRNQSGRSAGKESQPPACLPTCFATETGLYPDFLPYLLSKPLLPGQPYGAAVQAHRERGVTQGPPGLPPGVSSPRVWAGAAGLRPLCHPAAPLSQALAGPSCPGGPPGCPPMAPLPPCLRCWDPAGASPCRPGPSATSSPKPPRQEHLPGPDSPPSPTSCTVFPRLWRVPRSTPTRLCLGQTQDSKPFMTWMDGRMDGWLTLPRNTPRASCRSRSFHLC